MRPVYVVNTDASQGMGAILVFLPGMQEIMTLYERYGYGNSVDRFPRPRRSFPRTPMRVAADIMWLPWVKAPQLCLVAYSAVVYSSLLHYSSVTANTCPAFEASHDQR